MPSLKALKILSTLHILPLAALPFAMQPGPAMWALIAGFAGSWFWLVACVFVWPLSLAYTLLVNRGHEA